MKRFIVSVVVILVVSLNIFAGYKHPYGANSWALPDFGSELLIQAGIDRFRVFVSWRDIEKTDIPASEPWTNPGYNWWTAYVGVNAAKHTGAKLELAIYDSPDWARDSSGKTLSYTTSKFAEFVTVLLQYCEDNCPGCVEAIDFGNEDHIWGSRTEKDPSWYYANILKAGYQAVKAFNPNILVLHGCIWVPAARLLDELYQLGCGNYFDRLNIHYYVQGMGSIEDPLYTGSIYHYPTITRYVKYIAEQNGDTTKTLWNTEYGWKWNDEQTKSRYYNDILEIGRKSGYIDLEFMYPAISEHYPTTDCDYSSLIYCDNQWTPTTIVKTTSYWMYDSYSSQYPNWDPGTNAVPLTYLTPATNNINITNPGFELGNTNGWSNAILDNTTSHTGTYSGKQTNSNYMITQYYSAEPNRLYEVMFWIKIQTSGNVDNFYVSNNVLHQNNGSNTEWYDPPHVNGALCDTRNYPNGWRRIRYAFLLPSNKNQIAVRFAGNGTGTFWIDDVSVNRLNFGTLTIPTNNAPNAPINLKCEDQVNPRGITDTTPELSWTFSDPDPRDVQSAYQILIADNQTSLNNNTGNIWDTNKISGTSIKISYSGSSSLQPNTTYYWKIRTWDYNDLSGPYSSIGTFSMSANRQPNAPTNLLCMGLSNPMSITDFTPELSWNFNDPDTWDTQKSYRLLVDRSISNLQSNIGNIWDTGKINSQNNSVTYNGQPLQFSTSYYWKVMTWDSWDYSGPYSTIATFMTASSTQTNHPNAPINLKCNNQTNPNNVNPTAPVLSWTFSDPDPGDTQTAYRILVANSLSTLNSNNGNMWDTGKTNSSANSVTYSGSQLAHSVTYYWKVMTWDTQNSSGPYSAPATFVTGTQLTPVLSVSTATLEFIDLAPGEVLTQYFEITNTGTGQLNGTIFSDQEWIITDTQQFIIDSLQSKTVNVTVDNNVLNQKEGQYSGKITIVSDGGTETVSVIVTATCVLVKPNPYNPNKGLLTFFGSGIVPGETTIKIYTLSGELVRVLSAKTDELVWDGKTENGSQITNGIYLYTYDSPKEKGIGKFTVIIK